MVGVRDSVERHVDADPLTVWGLVSDVTQTDRIAVETESARWIGGATGPATGVRFAGRVNRNGWGVRYTSVCEITDCVPGEVFAFDVLISSMRVINWRYDLRPEGSGTLVRESFAMHDQFGPRIYWLLAGRWRGRTNRRNMTATLERLASAAIGG